MVKCGICGDAHTGACWVHQRQMRRIAEARVRELESNAGLTTTSNTPSNAGVESNAPSNGFDKRAYQREYMRRRRAAQKEI